MQYLHKTLGMKYSLVNPIQSYICPDSLTDIGRAYALLATIRFAREHTDYAETPAALHDFEELLQMWRNPTTNPQKDFSLLPLRTMDAADLLALSSHMIPYSLLVRKIPKRHSIAT